MTGILLILSRKGRIRAAELAGLFEVSERTIYRDVQALCELGVPVSAGTGSGGGYALEQGYFAEPVLLDAEECQAIYLGCDFVGRQRDFPLATAARRALTKLEAVMPHGRQVEAREVLGRIVWELRTGTPRDVSTTLEILRRGLVERVSVDMLYAPLDGEPQWRTVDSYELSFAGNAWYLEGYCHLRQEMRRFKVLRILDCRLGAQRFQRNDHAPQPRREDGPDFLVMVAGNSDRARILAEDPFFAPYLSCRDSDYLLTFPGTDFSRGFVLRFVLGLGQDGELLEPTILRWQLAEELELILSKYKQS